MEALAQVKYLNQILCMYISDYMLYAQTPFSKDCLVYEHTKTGRIKKGSGKQNSGIHFIKLVRFDNLYFDAIGGDTPEYKLKQLNSVHEKVLKGEFFNFASHNWLPKGLTKEEGERMQKDHELFMKEIDEYLQTRHITSAKDVILDELVRAKMYTRWS